MKLRDIVPSGLPANKRIFPMNGNVGVGPGNSFTSALSLLDLLLFDPLNKKW
jgi:hypothetical protein